MPALRQLALAVFFLVAWLGTGRLDEGRVGIGTAEAAGGCGIGFHRGPYGGCRPNVYGAPGYYRGGVVYGGRAVYGFRGGYYGRRVYGGRGVYGRRVGVYRGGFRGGGRFRR
ncbi:GCG_CRPN prefix-to-repeats domain-containing protein [Methylobacterium brachythecii]|uniref:Uncharacterized protein n=1 Tax=Methylobacterium brachythecii TaxID=1176177 RepID=A0A7W6F6Z7_9HYPH|nr:hypothetical protein [Methylobacterium brachythecii]MBB3902853.1 hypothetical protein [Methylobacterium brachythecii]GLS43779.1 hypothetical protein GCM10007884_17640 [Methylobacterium brachythecii]